MRWNTLKEKYDIVDVDKDGMPMFTYTKEGITKKLEELNNQTK